MGFVVFFSKFGWFLCIHWFESGFLPCSGASHVSVCTALVQLFWGRFGWIVCF